MIRTFDELIARLRAEPVKKRVAVVAAQDEHTLEAIVRAYRDGLVEPVLIGEREWIEELLERFGTSELKGAIYSGLRTWDCSRIPIKSRRRPQPKTL